MKTKSKFGLFVIVLTLMALALANLALSQSTTEKKKGKRAVVFMRQKLAYTQGVIEGLTLENFDMITTNGIRMGSMSQSNLWEVIYSDDYKKLTQDYYNNIMAMVDAARDKKIDVARDAFAKTLQSCYDCHKRFEIDRREKMHKAATKP